MEVEHRVVQRHRHLVLGLEGDRGGELLVVGDRRQLERAQHRALVGDADAHALAEPAVAEEVTQRLGERDLVEHFAVAHGVRGQRRRGRALGEDRAVDARLDGRDEARLDVQTDYVLAAAAPTDAGKPEARQLGVHLGDC